MTILMREEKQTKNTVRFAEEAEAPKIGTLYVPKATLREIGYKGGVSACGTGSVNLKTDAAAALACLRDAQK